MYIKKFIKTIMHLGFRAYIIFLQKIKNKFGANVVYLYLKISTFGWIKYDHEQNVYHIYDKSSGRRHYFGDPVRGYDLYRKGLKLRLMNLFNQYMLEKIKFNDDDVIIDCGANYADIGVAGKILLPHVNINYVSFEPGPIEYRCVSLNMCGGAKNINAGLADKSGKMTFYLKSDTADSSLIEHTDYDEAIIVPVITLDEFIESNIYKKIKLLKLEAEGYEPEIIAGAMQSLPMIEYISLDGGNERGINKEETASAVTNVLLRSGFKIEAINFQSQKILYRRIDVN